MCLSFEAEELSVRVSICSDLVMVLPTIGVGCKVFSPVFDPADGPAEAAGQPCEHNLFRQQDAFVAETAAHIWGDDADMAMIEIEALGEAAADNVGHLRGTMKDWLLKPRIPFRDDAAPFDWRHALPGGAEFALDLDRRLRGDRFDVADIDEAFEE